MTSATPGEPITSRRSLLLGAGIGVLAGGLWGAALQTMATPSTPRLSVIGRGRSQIALLDTTSLRVLILVGDLDENLVNHLPALMTMFRQRIDLMIGAASTILKLDRNLRDRWNVALTIMIRDQSGTIPTGATDLLISSNTSIHLDDNFDINLELTSRNDWTAEARSRVLWTANFRAFGSHTVFAPDTASIRELARPEPVLALVPDGNPETVLRFTRPAGIAMNRRDDLETDGLEGSDTRLVRIYPSDVAIFDYGNDGVTLPDWAEHPPS